MSIDSAVAKVARVKARLLADPKVHEYVEKYGNYSVTVEVQLDEWLSARVTVVIEPQDIVDRLASLTEENGDPTR